MGCLKIIRRTEIEREFSFDELPFTANPSGTNSITSLMINWLFNVLSKTTKCSPFRIKSSTVTWKKSV